MNETNGARRHSGLTSMLRPGSIAVIGASSRRKASGNEALANLRAHQFAGELVAVHPEAVRVDGVDAVPRIVDLPGNLDLALVSLPASGVLPALEALADRGCRSAIVPTVGLSAEQTRRFAELSRASAMAIHGPNSMGILNYTDGIPLWFYEGMLTEEPAGGTALVSQSGSACLFIVRAAPEVRFSKVISSGNELGVSMSDYLCWLAEDPATERVGVVIESLRDVEAFACAVGRLRAANKPIVALKVGRSSSGAAATIAHTGALIGAAAAYENLFDELDIPTVDDYDEMAAVLECLARQRAFHAAAGPRVAVVTISGGQAAMAADLADAKGVPLACLSEDTAARLLELGPGSVAVNPFDAGASLDPAPNGYADSLRALAADPGVDSMVVVLDALHTLNQAETSYEREFFEAVADVAADGTGKPIMIASSSSQSIHPSCRAWSGDVPVVRGIGTALVAARALARNRGDVVDRPAAARHPRNHDELRAGLLRHRGPVGHETVGDLLRAYGVPLVRSVVAADAHGAAAAADEIGYPVVVKVVSPDISHRSEVGGVLVTLRDAEAVCAGVARIAASVAHHAPRARIAGFEVQPYVSSSLEATVGFIADPVFGAMIMVGSGGTLVELMADTAVGAAPLTPTAARRALQRTRLARVAAGYRRLVPSTPLDGLVDTLVSISRLAADFSDVLTEADFNPVLVEHGTGRVQVVDALVIADGENRDDRAAAPLPAKALA